MKMKTSPVHALPSLLPAHDISPDAFRGPIKVLRYSPDCRHFSRAKGAK